MPTKGLTEYLYCDEHRLDSYFAHLPFPEEKIALLRKEILGLVAFKQAPKTLTLYLRPDNIQPAKEAYTRMDRRVAELAVN